MVDRSFGTSSPNLSTLVGLVAGAFGGVNAGAGEAGAIYNGVDEALSSFGAGGNNGDANPAAYLNYILFDENYNVLDMGWQAATGLNSQTLVSFPTKDIIEEGYLFVYLTVSAEAPRVGGAMRTNRIITCSLMT